MRKENPLKGTVMNIREVSELFRVTPHTIRDNVKKARFPSPVKIMGRYLWRYDDLEQVLRGEWSVDSKSNGAK